jgi:hypothetical protein
VRIQQPQGLLESLFDGKSNSGEKSGGSQQITINGINISASDLRDLMTPRLMYLWRGQ